MSVSVCMCARVCVACFRAKFEIVSRELSFSRSVCMCTCSSFGVRKIVVTPPHPRFCAMCVVLVRSQPCFCQRGLKVTTAPSPSFSHFQFLIHKACTPTAISVFLCVCAETLSFSFGGCGAKGCQGSLDVEEF